MLAFNSSCLQRYSFISDPWIFNFLKMIVLSSYLWCSPLLNNFKSHRHIHEDIPAKAFEIFSILSKYNISIDIILQATGRDNKKDITFTLAENEAEKVYGILSRNFGLIYEINHTKAVSKISIVGSGMINHPGVTASIFEVIADLNIDIQIVSTSEMYIALIIYKEDATDAVRELRKMLID